MPEQEALERLQAHIDTNPNIRDEFYVRNANQLHYPHGMSPNQQVTHFWITVRSNPQLLEGMLAGFLPQYQRRQQRRKIMRTGVGAAVVTFGLYVASCMVDDPQTSEYLRFAAGIGAVAGMAMVGKQALHYYLQ